MNPVSRYRIEVFNYLDERVAELTTRASDRMLIRRRNRADLLDLSLNLWEAEKLAIKSNMDLLTDILAVNRSHIRLYRDNVLLSAGELKFAEPQVADSQPTIRIQAIGWVEQFSQRLTGITQSYTATDAGQIAWDLINTSQNLTDGDFGITQGTIQASVNRDRSYPPKKNIRDAIIELSEVINGFDFEITPEKVFNVYYPRIGQVREDIVFTYPGNIRKIRFPVDGFQMANEVTALGAGSGNDVLNQTAVDTSSRAAYKLRQLSVNKPGVGTETELLESADEALRLGKSFIYMPSIVVDGDISPRFGTYNIGDTVQVSVTEYLKTLSKVNGQYRIEEMILTIDRDGHEIVQLKLSR